jgi:hypothetical protein
MVTRQISRTISKQSKPPTQMRTATVKDIIAPTTSDTDLVTGWQVLLDFGGGEISRAGVASTYTPIPGDVVTVMRYLNTLFVVDKVVAGDTGAEPGGRVAYAYYDAQSAATFATAAASAELAVPSLQVTFPCRNGAAYEIEVGGPLGYHNSVANVQTLFSLRLDTLAGALLGQFFRAPTAGAGQVHGFAGRRILRNDTGYDFDATVLLTFSAASANTASVYADTATRPFIEVTVKGSSKLYPHATAFPAPPDEPA